MLLLLACAAPTPLPSPGAAAEDVSTTEPPTTPAAVAAVLINEVQTDNDATIMTGDLEFADWVELYNASAETVALSRLTLSDANGETWTDSTGELAPGERLLLWADDDLPFGLSRDGEQLTLAVDGEVTDRIATGEMGADTAWARYPDGGSWAYTARPTPGWTNGSHPGASTDPTDALFQVDTITPVEVWVSDTEWAALSADNYTYVEATVAIGPAWFSRVGLRKKSTVGSNRTLDEKAAFKIDLNRYDNHSLGGMKGLTLNNMVQDPTYVAEHLAYTLYRAADIPAPRVGYVRLSINDEDWGLYALVETADDVFLSRWFADSSGSLFEGDYGTDLNHDELSELEVDEGDGDLTALTAIADVLSDEASDANIAQLDHLMDLDRLLLNMGIEAAILHWDGYTTANNYRLYHDPRTDRVTLLPWGTDQTFISSGYDPYEGYGLAYTFCLENEGCRARYGEALSDAADLLEGLALDEELAAVRAMLAADIDTDPRSEHSAADQKSYLSAMSDCIAGCPDSIRAAIE